MNELIGKKCRCVFNLPAMEWPIEGYPAWIVVVAVDMPMVCMKSAFAGKPIWINSAIIKTIEVVDREVVRRRTWWWLALD